MNFIKLYIFVPKKIKLLLNINLVKSSKTNVVTITKIVIIYFKE